LHFGSVSCDFLHFWKKLTGCRAIFFIGFLEVPYGIFCIFGSSSWDFANLGSSFLKYTQSHVELPKMRKSQEKLPNMHKILRGSSENAQNHMIDFK
jgi:hypothetical protein